ncbi:MAG: replicative DNA helicase [Kiritimatiellia bacterium]|nr:replicative DNA helicase [Kiritimatiellia bacterium]MDP6629718.1 replicative DNA helicase [Kiritimatiellia bacterium]MDP6810957.1 replicative DNA helicase [Kiritimatiellia bacterium]MDP7023262.1 replicative DNA helicase [Kiritimatiellia bacterium]
MVTEASSSVPPVPSDRVPPYSEEAEKGVLGSILLDSVRVMDLCIEHRLDEQSFYAPVHRTVFEAMLGLHGQNRVIDVLTVSDQLRDAGKLDGVGGVAALNQLIDATPTAAHAEYYIDIVYQKHLLRRVISCARAAESECYGTVDSADQLLGSVEQAFLDINEQRYGSVTPWSTAVKETMSHVDTILETGKGVTGLSTGFENLDRITMGLRAGEMIVLAARPSMGKTSLAMNIAENVALGKMDPDGKQHTVGIFSLEMSYDALAMRMLCSHAAVPSQKIQRGYVSKVDHGKLVQAASVLNKAPIFLDDTGGLDVLELRARARRMRKKHNVELIVIDYLQLMHSKEYARQGRQIETSQISGNIKAMAKELRVPVLVLSQLSRAPEQRDSKSGKPKLSDLRDSGAIEQDADVVYMLRRPCRYPDDDQHDDRLLAIVDVAKHRNGPTGEVKLNFEEEYTRFRDRARGVDDFGGMEAEDE